MGYFDHFKHGISGECKVCHFIYDPTLGPCPACQDKARGEAYGTAWGTLSTATYHNPDRRGPHHTCVDQPNLPCSGCDYAEEQSGGWQGLARGNTPAEDREEFRIPMGDAAQTYELRRMFRL